jgi:glycosyltransferase involved in cell wall biosynthesis
VPSLVREIDPPRDLTALAALARLLGRLRGSSAGPLVVHTHSSKAGILGRLAARVAGVRHVVHTFHGFGFHDGQPRALRTALVAAERAVRPLTHAFVCVSRENLRAAVGLGIADPARTTLIRSGFDLARFRPGAADGRRLRAELGLAAATPLVGSVACFKPQKAPLDFVAAAQRIARVRPDVHFVMAGDGVLRGEAERARDAAGLQDRLHLLGWRRDVPDVLAALDAFALCSRWEGLPRVIPQAQCLGVPVVATAVDGSREAIEEGRTGFQVPPGDPDAMAKRLLRLLDDPELRRRIGAAAAASVDEFDAALMVERHAELYARLIQCSAQA